MQLLFVIIEQAMLDTRPSGISRLAVDTAERPVDLSQSAANFKTSPNSAAVNTSHSCLSRVSAAANVSGASFVCCKNPISSSLPYEPLTFPTGWGSNVDGHVSLVNSLPINSTYKVFPVPTSGFNQNIITTDIWRSAGSSVANFNHAMKSESLAHSADPFAVKNSTGNSNSETTNCSVQYPKTKKQKAVDSKVPSLTSSLSATMVDGTMSGYEALTFGEIQERLITKVVESGSLSGVLCDEQQQHLRSTCKQHTAGNVPAGQFSSCESSQNQLSLTPEATLSEHCNRQKVGSLLMTSSSLSNQTVKQKALTAQGLWFQDFMSFCYLCEDIFIS